MPNRVQHRIAVRFKNRFFKLAVSPPVGALRHHVVGDIRRRDMVVSGHDNRVHLDFRTFPDNESHRIFMVGDRRFAKPDFRKQVSLGAVIAQNVLPVAFEPALAIDPSLQKAHLEPHILFRNFVAAFDIDRIERRKLHDAEHQIDLAFRSGQIIHPGGNIVKISRFKQIRDALLDLFRKHRRLKRLSVANAHPTQHGAFIHIDKTFGTNPANGRRSCKVFRHIEKLRHRECGKKKQKGKDAKKQVGDLVK